MSRLVRPIQAITFSRSRTVPGQNLTPADLLRRHLAGTLPDIDHTRRNEYHYDENGEQISYPMPMEYHEIQALAVEAKKRAFEADIEKRKQQAQKFRDKIIADYQATLQKLEPPSTSSSTTQAPPA